MGKQIDVITYAASKEYTNKKLQNLDLTDIDLSNYCKTTDVDTKISAKLSDVDTEIDKIWEEINYVSPSIKSFTMNPNTTIYEVGTDISVGALTFEWTLNKTATSLTGTNLTFNNEDATKATSATNSSAITSSTTSAGTTMSKSFSITMTDSKNKTATSSKTIYFRPYVYYGASTEPSTYNDTFIKGLSSKEFKTSKSGSYSMTLGDNEYGYIALPNKWTSKGKLSANIGGFDTELEYAVTISFKNNSGYTQDYDIYKTTQPKLGSITMKIS